MVFMTVFIALISVNAVKGLIAVIKKDSEPHFESVSTLFAFYVFSLFFAHLFDGTDVLISSIEFSQLFKGSYMTNYSWGEMTLGELFS